MCTRQTATIVTSFPHTLKNVARVDQGDAVLASLATRQHGVVSAVQLLSLGYSRANIDYRARHGRLHRVYRGVYAVGHRPRSREARWMAAVLATGTNAGLSHESAAMHWNIWRGAAAGPNSRFSHAGYVHVLATSSRKARPGIYIHRTASLEPRDITIRNSIPVTTVARTVIDLASVLTPAQLANVMHEAEFRSMLSQSDFARMQRISHVPGAQTLRIAIDLNHTGSVGTRSFAEDAFLALVEHHRIARPKINSRIEIGRQSIEVDFHWPRKRLCVEIDGEGHSRQRTQRSDAARDQALVAHGWRVVRFTRRDVLDCPDEIARLVRTNLHARR